MILIFNCEDTDVYQHRPTAALSTVCSGIPSFLSGSRVALGLGGAYDMVLAALKRTFLLLPMAAIIFACWATVLCLVTVIVRQHRRQYVSTVFITWWDLFRTIFSFWGGTFKFVFMLIGWLFSALRIIIIGLWLSLQDILFTPLRAVKGVGNLATTAGTPWIAVGMTLAWCALEAFLFTFVMTNLVVETLSSVTGLELDTLTVQSFLYFMLLAFVIGSYAIVATLEQAVKSGNVKQIALIGLVEFVTLVFEVVFFFIPRICRRTSAMVCAICRRRFSTGRDPILLIGTIVWAGIRGMTWFLFAAHGTPTIMAIIQRTGLRSSSGGSVKKADQFLFIP